MEQCSKPLAIDDYMELHYPIYGVLSQTQYRINLSWFWVYHFQSLKMSGIPGYGNSWLWEFLAMGIGKKLLHPNGIKIWRRDMAVMHSVQGDDAWSLLAAMVWRSSPKLSRFSMMCMIWNMSTPDFAKPLGSTPQKKMNESTRVLIWPRVDIKYVTTTYPT